MRNCYHDQEVIIRYKISIQQYWGFFFTPMEKANEFPLKEIRNVNKHQRNRLRVFTRFNGRKKNQNKSQKLTNYETLTLEIDNIWGGPPVKGQSVDGVTHPVLQPPKHISLLWEIHSLTHASMEASDGHHV